jgi:phage shock protein PspC (stress-responsive transcriptional regulator)
MIAGVSAGLARYLDVDPVVVRVGFALLTVMSGAGLLAYLACWILMPNE